MAGYGIPDFIGQMAPGSGVGAALGGPLGWATLGTQVLGGLFGGLAGGADQRRQMAESARQRQLDRQLQERAMGSSEGDQALGYQRSLENAPMRDRATYMMQARMGMTPGQFSPGDIFTPGSYGGIDNNQLQQTNQQYQPGMGGTQGSQDMMQQFIETLKKRAGSLSGTPYTPTARQATPVMLPRHLGGMNNWRNPSMGRGI